MNFMGTNEVTSLDVFMLDDNKLIWKFDRCYALGVYSLNKFTILDEKEFTFSQFEDLECHWCANQFHNSARHEETQWSALHDARPYSPKPEVFVYTNSLSLRL
ncbi:hypothetical protein MKW98_022012 [Papaver atlanticum]|uniref:Uncharacterized protein n=1 Tax=Papaver atlanticum TaxID=357466 RepID=A0AAD4T7G7_9MAGN|nr:hypothetical protein MKW98_022012 [Papaver atlanticum]